MQLTSAERKEWSALGHELGLTGRVLLQWRTRWIERYGFRRPPEWMRDDWILTEDAFLGNSQGQVPKRRAQAQ